MTSKGRPLSRRIPSPGVVLPLAASLPFFWLWYSRYLRIDFNELGRHYDAATQTVHTDAAFVWCLPALGFLLIAVVNLVRQHRSEAETGQASTARRAAGRVKFSAVRFGVLAALAAAAIAGALMSWHRIDAFIAIDDCLDKGHRWNPESRVCRSDAESP